MIFGNVTDPSKAAVVNAAVTVQNTDTNTHASVQTNSTGYYEVSFLLPGNYQVTTEAPGFKRTIRSGIVLQVSSRVEADLQLELGAVGESISVTAATGLLETNSVSAGRVIDNRSVMDLPYQGASVMLLVRLTPGISTGGVNNELGLHSNSGGSDYEVAGGVGSNSWSLDGVPNNGNSRRTAYLPVADTVAEMKVDTANFDVSIGHTTGAVISMISKSGTNALHGTGMWQHWQRRWNGTPFFVKKQYYTDILAADLRGDHALADRLRSREKQPSGRSNTYVATVGGPVVLPKVYNGKDRLFFFFSYTKRVDKKTEDATSINRTIPTMLQREGNFTELLRAPNGARYQIYDPLSVRADPARPGFYIRDPFVGNIIPRNRFQNPVYDAYLKLLPTPNNSGANLEHRNNYLAVGTPYNWDYKAFSNRVDYNATQNHRTFVRWSYNDFLEDRGDWTYESARGLHANGLNRNNVGATADWVWTKSASTIFDFSVALNQFREGNIRPVALGFKPSDVGFPAYMDQQAGSRHQLPFIDFDDAYQDIGFNNVSVLTRYRAITGKVDATHIRGKHSVRAGFENRQQFRTGGGGGNTSGNFQFRNTYTRKYSDTREPAGNLAHQWAAFIMGMSNSMTIATTDSFALHNPSFGVYIHDNYRLTPRLTLNVGLRLEYERGQTERYNRLIGQFVPNMALPVSALAEQAYAKSPIPQVDPSQFKVLGGVTYLGSNGATRQAWPSEWMLMPRLSAAWQISNTTVLRFGYGRYFDTLNVLNETDDNSQAGFSRTTSTPVNDSEQNWLVANPNNGRPPISDPFPIRADGTRFDIPTRDALGSMALLGQNFTFNGDHIRRARQQRWRAGVQRQIGNAFVFEIAYQGAFSDRVNLRDTGAWRELNTIPGQYYSTGLKRNDENQAFLDQQVANPFQISNFESLKASHPLVYQDMLTRTFFTNARTARNRLVRPFPHMGNDIRATRFPGGQTKVHALEISAEKRFSKGLSFNIGYTAMRIRDRDFFANPFDTEPSWREGNDGRPHRLIATTIYELPFGQGRALLREGFLRHIVGGWQLGVTYEYQPGPLLDFGNLFYYGNPDEINTGDRTLGRWFNTTGVGCNDTVGATSGFERCSARGPASYHVRVFPTRLSGLRRDMTNQWNANVKRKIGIREGMHFELQLDAINVMNRSQFEAPDRTAANSTFGEITEQTGATNRFIQVGARLVF